MVRDLIRFLRYDEALLEDLDATSLRGVRSLLEALTRPPSRFYIRVNTLRADPSSVLDGLREKGLDFHVDEEVDVALYAPIRGPFEVTPEGKAVVADKRSAESVYLGSDLYAPGVLKAEGVRRNDRVTVFTPEGVPVGSGTAMMTWSDVLSARRGLAVKVERSVYQAPKVGDLSEAAGGLIYSQSLPSMWAVLVADPRPGELIIDMNAAPGGKVSFVAQLTGPSARIVAFDRKSKADRLRQNLASLNIDWVSVIGADSRQASSILGVHELADLVLVDPPCTNLGVIPKLSDRRGVQDAVTLSRYQVQFVREAWRLLRPGGRLVYSTCTLTDIENEWVVERAVEMGFDVERPPKVPRHANFNGLGIRFSPEDGVPGFFTSLLRKPGGAG